MKNKLYGKCNADMKSAVGDRKKCYVQFFLEGYKVGERRSDSQKKVREKRTYSIKSLLLFLLLLVSQRYFSATTLLLTDGNLSFLKRTSDKNNSVFINFDREKREGRKSRRMKKVQSILLSCTLMVSLL